LNLFTCEKVITEISNYLDGDLDEDLKRSLEAHINKCQHCRVVFDTTRKTIELYCDGKLFPLPDDVRARLHEAIRRRWRERQGNT